MQDYQHLALLDYKLNNLLFYGQIKEIDKDKHKARIEIGELLTNWLPLPRVGGAKFSVYYLPPVGASVLCLAPNGRLENAFIIQYFDFDFKTDAGEEELKIEFEDGAFLHYKPEGEFELQAKKIKLKSDDLEIDAKTSIKQDLEIDAKTSIKQDLEIDAKTSIKQDLKCDAKINASGDIESSGNVKGAECETTSGIKLSTHKHVVVNAGQSPCTTQFTAVTA